MDQDHLLSEAAHRAITAGSNELLLGAATIWELGIKLSLSKLSLTLPFRQWMMQAIRDLQISILPIGIEYVEVQAALPFHHRDPFDRMLAAQAQVEQIPLVSADLIFEQYGVNRIW